MDFEQTEQEQIEQLRKWWKENWLPLLGGLTLGLGGILGWDQFQAWKADTAAGASQSFDRISNLIADGKSGDASNAADALIADYPKSPYASHAKFALAKTAAEAGSWPQAIGHLSWVVDNAKQPELVTIATLRLARAKWAAGDNDGALALLNSDSAGPFAFAFAELRGDIQRRAGQIEAARTAYQRAIDIAEPGADTAGLQRKIDDLPRNS